jgi:hypothetical protein
MSTNEHRYSVSMAQPVKGLKGKFEEWETRIRYLNMDVENDNFASEQNKIYRKMLLDREKYRTETEQWYK